MIYSERDVTKLNNQLDMLFAMVEAGDHSHFTQLKIRALQRKIEEVVKLQPRSKPKLTLIIGGKQDEVPTKPSFPKPFGA